MHEQSQNRSSQHNSRRREADHAQNAVNDRVQHAGVGHDAEIEDSEYKHGRNWRNLLYSVHHKNCGGEPETACQRSNNWD